MKKLALIFTFAFLSGYALHASGDQVIKETEKGKSIEVSIVTDGNISLFSHSTEILPATIPQDPLDSFTTTYTTYYLSKGDSEMVEVHCGNYKKVLKEQMSDKPEVAQLIGQKGYRLPDIQSIVETYNND